MLSSRSRRLLLGLCLCSTVAACDLEITVCERPENLNTCSGDSDCFLAYCGVDCCACERVVSARQFDETYCMLRTSEGHGAAREECQEARDTNCENVDCLDFGNACAHPYDAACVEGRCEPVY